MIYKFDTMFLVIEMKEEFNIEKNNNKIVEYSDIKTNAYDSIEAIEKLIREMFSISSDVLVKIQKNDENNFSVYLNNKYTYNIVFYPNENDPNANYSAMIIDSNYIIHKLLLRETPRYIIGKLLSLSFEKDGNYYYINKKPGDKIEMSVEKVIRSGRKKGVHIYTSSFKLDKDTIIQFISNLDVDASIPCIYSYLEEKLGISINESEKIFIKKYNVEPNVGISIKEYIEIRNGVLENYELICPTENNPVKIIKTYGEKHIIMDREDSIDDLFKIFLKNQELVDFISKTENCSKKKTKKH